MEPPLLLYVTGDRRGDVSPVDGVRTVGRDRFERACEVVGHEPVTCHSRLRSPYTALLSGVWRRIESSSAWSNA